ncbi:MAG: hypothetical protein FWE21_07690 [Defluviitaleaceae bacterium]|nr:hypothetical protein [Defluviitaleaceae bacterium]
MIDLLKPYKTISIIGMDKNVGKTTLLNHLIAGFAADGQSLALTSIGRDGEDTDLVTSTPKPRIYVPVGAIVATAEGLLPQCDITLEVQAVTAHATPLGRIVMVRALSAGYVQLAGPSIVAQMADIIQNMPTTDKVIIDGAISRKTFANPAIAQSAVLCTGATLSPNMDEVAAKTRHAVDILTLPKAHEATDNILMEGAVTEGKIKHLITSGTNLQGKVVVADDPTKILITAATYEKLHIKGATLAVKSPLNLVAVAINPFSPRGGHFPPQDFLSKMQAALPLPVFDILEANHV